MLTETTICNQTSVNTLGLVVSLSSKVATSKSQHFASIRMALDDLNKTTAKKPSRNQVTKRLSEVLNRKPNTTIKAAELICFNHLIGLLSKNLGTETASITDRTEAEASLALVMQLKELA
jgi:hypothetical protein